MCYSKIIFGFMHLEKSGNENSTDETDGNHHAFTDIYVHLINMRSDLSINENDHFLKILSALMIELAISDTVTCLFIASVLMRA